VGASVLLVCGAQTDARAWVPVIEALGACAEVEVVEWPREPPFDVVDIVDARIRPGQVYDVAVGAGQGVDGAVQAARRDAARCLILIGPGGGLALMTEMEVDLDSMIETTVAGLSPAMDEIANALRAGDAATYARLAAEQLGTQIGPEHRETVEAMILEHTVALRGESMGLAPYHPWADWLRDLTQPTTLVFNEQAAVDRSLGQRHAQALLARCQHGTAVTIPYADPGYVGMSHPDEVVALIQEALEVAGPARPTGEGG
jgi:quinol monooxygenase YgiN